MTNFNPVIVRTVPKVLNELFNFALSVHAEMRSFGDWQDALLSKPNSSSTTIFWKDRCWNCKKTECSNYKCTQPIDETECSKNKVAWKKEDQKPNNIRRRRKTTPRKWRPTSPEKFGTRVINGKSYTWNNNGSWKIDATPDSGLTPEDAAAATFIATAAAAINNTKQRIAGTALNAASVTTKAIKFPITIGGNYGNTTVAEIATQDQLNEFTYIQANLGN